MLSGRLWPAHPHPYPDELLSSWIVRVAHANGLKVQTFCAQQFGNEHQIWNRDIDRLAPAWLLEIMSKKTGTPFQQVRETTLLSYQGKLYEKYHAAGQLRWILPLQIYHRTRKGYGLQFCPQCLAAEPNPYYRKSWRVALSTFCPKHNVILLDRCQNCGNPISFHRLELGRPNIVTPKSLSDCYNCNMSLILNKQIDIGNYASTLTSWRNINSCLSDSQNNDENYNYLYLSVLHQFCRLLVSKKLAPKLLTYLCEITEQPNISITITHCAFEQRSVIERHHIISLAWWLIDDWPEHIHEAWRNKKVRYNELLRDFHNAPIWYSDAVRSLLEANENNVKLKLRS